ncbi:MAG: HAMP domain-containing sensor histidine kinase [bacterium]|nr:HAMP domain-containing sensor histidine kinase [bacterium]
MEHMLVSFFKDQKRVTIAFALSDFLLISFYYLTIDKEIELIYPILLSISVYAIYLAIEFYRYRALMKKVESLRQYEESNRQVQGCLDEYISQSMTALHKEYQNKLFEQRMEKKETERFLSTWIHNLKTPLSVNKLLIERYERGEVKKKEFIEQLNQENERTTKQLDLVLEMIRLKEFVVDYTPSRIDLGTELNRILNEQKRLFIYNRVYPKIDGDLNGVTVLSDGKWNDLVLTQLISNAVKYSASEEQKYIHFGIKKQEKTVTLYIKDEGIGIPDYDQSRIFEAFFTGENGRLGKRSSGIGLYFCKEVCELLGQQLKIESKAGTGTIASITYLTKVKG